MAATFRFTIFQDGQRRAHSRRRFEDVIDEPAMRGIPNCGLAAHPAQCCTMNPD